MELQTAWQNLHKNGVAVYAISYDSVEVLAGFAAKRGISYPLLSDEGSHIIHALGLLNEQHLVDQHAFYGIQTRDEQRGVAYPGTFVLDERGVIAAKHFDQSYRVRPSAGIFEEYALGPSAATSTIANAPHSVGPALEVRAWTDAPTYHPYQQLRLHVDVSIRAEAHVFAAPVPDGYTPLSLAIDALDGLEVDRFVLPDGQPFTVAGLDDQFLVYEGSLGCTIPLRFTRNLGPTVITLRVAYQACTPTECFPPAALHVDIPLNGLDLIRD